MALPTNAQANREVLNLRIQEAAQDLHLGAVLKDFDKRCAQAASNGEEPRSVLADLLEIEVEERRQRRVARRLKEAAFPRLKTMDDFDFARAPELPKSLIHELTTGDYMGAAQGVIFIGEPGSGKTHLATSLGVAACRQSRRVRFVTAATLVNDLVEAKDARALGNAVKRYAKVDLLIIDDLGYLPLANNEAELLFQVIAERNERSSMIITTNLPFSEFTKVFPDQRLCAAVIDRITHNAHIIDTGSLSRRGPVSTPNTRAENRRRKAS